jgi:rod shape-determining protein MreD|tara:strand:- start:4799 stop:5281 length:483 start_codon:yes stop_codon:yes gene_type:complete
MQFSFPRFFLFAVVLQLVFSELLTVNGFQPNIMLLFVILSSISMENISRATLIGFSIGLLSDLILFNGSYIGLSSLIFSICAYLSARVSFNFVYRNFDLYWLVLVALGTGLYAFFRYDFFFFNDIMLFLKNWILLAIYTSFVGFIITRLFKVKEGVLENA